MFIIATRTTKTTVKTASPPETLDKHIFFGMGKMLDEEQREFRDAIWNKNYDAVICEAKAGTGKTLIAVATSILLVEYGLYSGIVYQSAAGVYEHRQGLLPGTLQQKNYPLFGPLYQTVVRLGYDPMRIIATDDNMLAQKEGTAIITAQSDSYIRGLSFGEKDSPVIIILDEAQNYTLPAMRTSITRVNDGSKLIVIGEQRQCDLKYTQDSGFPAFISLFEKQPWCKKCKLTHNYRGKISALGDEL